MFETHVAGVPLDTQAFSLTEVNSFGEATNEGEPSSETWLADELMERVFE